MKWLCADYDPGVPSQFEAACDALVKELRRRRVKAAHKPDLPKRCHVAELLTCGPYTLRRIEAAVYSPHDHDFELRGRVDAFYGKGPLR